MKLEKLMTVVILLSMVFGHTVAFAGTDRSSASRFSPRVITSVIPHGDIEDWVVLFVDVETTGLDPDYNEMIDVGIVVSGMKGTRRDTFFTRIMPKHPERTAPGAREVNGFSVKRWEKQGAVKPAKAVYLVKHFIKTKTSGNHVLFTAYNASFDRGFLSQLFDRHGIRFERFYDHVLDLPRLASKLGFGYGSAGELARTLRVTDEPRHSTHQPWKHTGLTGAKLNHRLYSQLIKKDKYKGMSPEEIKQLQEELIEN